MFTLDFFFLERSAAVSAFWAIHSSVWGGRCLWTAQAPFMGPLKIYRSVHSSFTFILLYLLWTMSILSCSTGTFSILEASIVFGRVVSSVSACMCLLAWRSKTITTLCGSNSNNRQVGGILIHLRRDLSHCRASKALVYCLTSGYKLRLKFPWTLEKMAATKKVY